VAGVGNGAAASARRLGARERRELRDSMIRTPNAAETSRRLCILPVGQHDR
jgi:hypothetical protein